MNITTGIAVVVALTVSLGVFWLSGSLFGAPEGEQGTAASPQQAVDEARQEVEQALPATPLTR